MKKTGYILCGKDKGGELHDSRRFRKPCLREPVGTLSVALSFGFLLPICAATA
jgi:hypothetical protein